MSELTKRILEKQLVKKGIPPEEVKAEAFTMPDKAEKKSEQKPRKFKKRPVVKERLPDGSRFDVQYDAKTQTWSGSLMIPTLEAELESSCSGVHGLLMKLFQMYKRATTPKEEGR